ncbi:putative beta-1,4-xylosyltransferase IRX9 [Canna indica]|uniref:Glycosyltransferases n=1 Tax=Canna indica TaxID=4628 RepID=A0AAQ3KFC9_9LILI|nr:putative beta-1,4-xylosyltransferase IRX9 [Canna indica]
MGTIERTKKKNHLWKKAFGHFALCFVMGFFTGFAPPSTATLFAGRAAEHLPGRSIGILPTAPAEAVERVLEPGVAVNRTMIEIPRSVPTAAVGRGGGDESGDDPPPPLEEARMRELQTPSQRLLIVVTTTRSNDRFQGAFLRRLANTLRLVPPPLLWIVVQAHAGASATASMLRTTGVMYRHLTFKENFTDPEAEADHQRNVALSHVEYHRLTGIVHFAGASNVYDLQFFDEIRQIEVFGTWPVAMVSENRKRVVVDGPICHSSKVEGWILKDLSSDRRLFLTSTDVSTTPSKINISGFAFNSSILWDPERWGRSTSLPDTSQDSIKFVHEVILEDETKLKGIPADCSRIMVWHLHIPRVVPLPFHNQNHDKR